MKSPPRFVCRGNTRVDAFRAPAAVTEM